MSIYVIAEIGSNWNPKDRVASVEKLVEEAAEAGANAVKMQDWSPIEKMNRSEEWKERCLPWTVDSYLLRTANRKAADLDMDFFCSVFTQDAIRRALMSRMPHIKIASSEVTNQALLAAIQMSSFAREILRLHKQNMGMSGDVRRGLDTVFVSLGEVRSSFQVTTLIARFNLLNVVLMGCVSQYPLSRGLDLLDALTYAEQFGLPTGVSSHVAIDDAVQVISAAVKKGVRAVEMHIRDREATPDDAPDNGPWALYPNEFARVVEAIREGEDA